MVRSVWWVNGLRSAMAWWVDGLRSVMACSISWVWFDWVVACESVVFVDVGWWVMAYGSMVVGC